MESGSRPQTTTATFSCLQRVPAISAVRDAGALEAGIATVRRAASRGSTLRSMQLRRPTTSTARVFTWSADRAAPCTSAFTPMPLDRASRARRCMPVGTRRSRARAHRARCRCTSSSATKTICWTSRSRHVAGFWDVAARLCSTGCRGCLIEVPARHSSAGRQTRFSIGSAPGRTPACRETFQELWAHHDGWWFRWFPVVPDCGGSGPRWFRTAVVPDRG